MKSSATLQALASAVLLAAPGPSLSQPYLSPSAEFEQKMAPHKRQEFVLPSSADADNSKNPTRVFNAGRRQSSDNTADDSTKLIQEIKRQQAEETRLNRTYSDPNYARPMPKQVQCSGAPIVCVER